MKIYVAGPYGDQNSKEIIARNVGRADQVGRFLARMGHTPFIPHKMTWGWEDDPDLNKSDFMRIDLEWLSFCNAIFLLPGWENSTGTLQELEFARSLKLPEYYDLDLIPDA